MHFLRNVLRFCKRLFWAISVAYMVALHNVYREEDKILYQVEASIKEDQEDENSTSTDDDTTEDVTITRPG